MKELKTSGFAPANGLMHSVFSGKDYNEIRKQEKASEGRT